MDLKTFSGDDFDPKKWINKAWSSSGSQEKEVFVANTVTRLQLYMKQLTNSLDETTTQIVSSIPRVVQDASSLQAEGAVLQQRLLSLESKVQGVEEQTGHSIQSLQRIDQLKSRLENAASALREADKWAAMVAALEEGLDRGLPTAPDQLKELSDQVAAMTASLEVLSEAPDYESKRMQLETLYNRLEAAVSPPLVDALTAMDAERLSRYVPLLCGMNRASSLARCWRRSAATHLARRWSNDPHSHRALTALLQPVAHTQVSWLRDVLKCEEPASELLQLYTDLLLSLDPAPTKVAAASLNMCSSPEEGLQFLIDLRRDIDEFLACVKDIIEAPHAEAVRPALVREVYRAALGPLRALAPRYQHLQGQWLHERLGTVNIDQEDILERSLALLHAASQCGAWLASASHTARAIAGRAMYPYYLSAAQSLITTISSHMSAHSRRIESTFLESCSTGAAPPGVLSPAFPAALQLAAAYGALLDALAGCQQHANGEETDEFSLELESLLCSSREGGGGGGEWGGGAALRRARDQVNRLARTVLRQPVQLQLDKIPSLPVWRDNDALSTELPDYAISPQEYITEIGQYLMTLPQHLEMHLSEKQAPWQYLAEVCSHTCSVFAERLLRVSDMDALGSRRAATDIEYLCSVVEDLDCLVPPALASLRAGRAR